MGVIKNEMMEMSSPNPEYTEETVEAVYDYCNCDGCQGCIINRSKPEAGTPAVRGNNAMHSKLCFLVGASSNKKVAVLKVAEAGLLYDPIKEAIRKVQEAEDGERRVLD